MEHKDFGMCSDPVYKITTFGSISFVPRSSLFLHKHMLTSGVVSSMSSNLN